MTLAKNGRQSINNLKVTENKAQALENCVRPPLRTNGIEYRVLKVTHLKKRLLNAERNFVKNGIFRVQTVLLFRKLAILTAPTSFPPGQGKGPWNEVVVALGK